MAVRRRSAAVHTLAVILSLGSPVAAVEGENLSGGDHRFVVAHWGTDDGLPQSDVLSVAQTADGFLWLGTQEGLARFDGVAFRNFDRNNVPGMTDQFITALEPGSDGGLWVGTRSGLFHYREDKWRSFGQSEGLPDHYIRSLAASADGGVWVGTYGAGLARVEANGQVVALTAIELPDPFVRDLLIDRHGLLWVATTRGTVRIDDGEVSLLYGPEQGLGNGFVRALVEDRQGAVWIGTEGSGLFRVVEGRVRQVAGPGEDVETIHAMIVDRQGNVWAATEPEGLLRVSSNGEQTTVSRGFVWTLCEDSEGSIWVGSTDGLSQLKPGRTVTFGRGQGLRDRSVRTVYEDRAGRVWVGTDDGGVQRFDGDRFRDVPGLTGIEQASVRSISGDASGRLWIGTRVGISRLERDGRLRRFGTNDGLDNRVVNAIVEDSRGRIWAGTGGGLVVWNGRAFAAEDLGEKVPNPRVRTLLPMPDGSLWVGTEEGLFHSDDDNWTRWGTNEGLRSEFVLSLASGLHGELWVGTASGLSVVHDGKVTNFSTSQGVPERAVFSLLVESEDDDLWMCTSNGIVRVVASDLLDLSRGRLPAVHTLRLGTADGLASSECNGGTYPAAWRRRDGGLLFATAGGLVEIRREELHQRRRPPRAVIDAVKTDRGTADPHSTVAVEFPPETSSFEFRYAAPTFLSPNSVVYRYRLDGFHNDWVFAGSRREAFFTNLQPGSYRFLVSAAAENGVWDEMGSQVRFRVAPHFYQRREVRLAALAALLSLVVAAFMIRSRQQRRREGLMRAMVAERTEQLERANRMLEGLAATDALTGLTNYRRFQEALREEWRRGMRHRQPLALILLDIDYFKRFNDTYGHAEGDACLRRVAHTLRELVYRGGDLVARYGGEEFAVLLPGTDLESAELLADRFRRGIEALCIANSPSEVSDYVTISAGVAAVVPDGELEPGSLFDMADQALYQAKRNGRNRVELCCEPQAEPAENQEN